MKYTYHKQVDILTNQIFFAIDKGIIDNKIKVTISEGNITCHITIKTSTHVEKKLLFSEDEALGDEENDNAKHMHI